MTGKKSNYGNLPFWIGFGVRHFAALAVTVAVACAVWTLCYFALLIWAVATNSGVGGPLAFPAGLIFFGATTAVAGVVLLFPSTALAEWLARRLGWPIPAQIPLSVAFLALFCLAFAGIAATLDSPPPNLAFSFGILFLSLLFPLGFYWWLAQAAPILRALLRWKITGKSLAVLRREASLASRADFERVLAKAPKVPADPGDSLD